MRKQRADNSSAGHGTAGFQTAFISMISRHSGRLFGADHEVKIRTLRGPNRAAYLKSGLWTLTFLIVAVSYLALLSARPMEASFIRGDRGGLSDWHPRGERTSRGRAPGCSWLPRDLLGLCFLLLRPHRSKFGVKQAASLRTLTYQYSVGLKNKKSLNTNWGILLKSKPKSVSLPELESEIHLWINFCCSFCYRNGNNSRIWIAFWDTLCRGEGDRGRGNNQYVLKFEL